MLSSKLKKTIVLLTILFSMFLVFAETSSSTSLDFKAYYRPNNVGDQKYISIDIMDVDDSGAATTKVYQTATIEHEQTGTEGQNNTKTVYIIRLKGNFTGKISLHITTSPLQAYYDGYYYIPEHRFGIYKDSTFLFRIAEFNGGQGPAAGDYQFPNAKNGTKNLPVNSDSKSGNNKIRNVSVTSTDNSEWVLDYSVMLTIVESTKSAGEYHYYSNITVEVDAEET